MENSYPDGSGPTEKRLWPANSFVYEEHANLYSRLITIPHDTPFLSEVTIRVFQFFVSSFGRTLLTVPSCARLLRV